MARLLDLDKYVKGSQVTYFCKYGHSDWYNNDEKISILPIYRDEMDYEMIFGHFCTQSEKTIPIMEVRTVTSPKYNKKYKEGTELINVSNIIHTGKIEFCLFCKHCNKEAKIEISL